MKVAVVNLSGNTGKTTLTKHLLHSQIGEGQKVRRVNFDGVNSGDGEPDQDLNLKAFKTLAGELNMAEDDEHFVIDIGSSNAPAMLQLFKDFGTTRDAIDYWVVPAVPTKKQILDSTNTIDKLIEIGVEPENIVVVLNNVTDIDSVEFDFKPIYEYRKDGITVADEVVLASEIFEMLKGLQENVFDVVNQPFDLKALRKAAMESDDPVAAKLDLGTRSVMRDMANVSVRNLKKVFQSTPMYTNRAV